MNKATLSFGAASRFLSAFLLLGTALLAPPKSLAQTFIQVNSAVPSSGAQVGTVYALAQAAGDLNVVIVGWNDTTAVVTSVSDTKGNSYVLAAGPTLLSGSLSQSIYYAKNIAAAAANSNTVTVKFSISANSPDIRILEYSGLDTVNPLDGATGVTGSSSTTDSGPLTTTNANDLLVGANIVFSSTAAPGTGFTRRIITNPDGDIAEDQLVSAVGSYHATASLTRADSWIMQIVAFKASGAAPSPTAPANLSASSISSSQINLSWSASTEAGGTISSYLLERCQGVGCSNFAQITSLPSTSFTDSGLAPSTSYSYRVRAQDTLGILGAYSNTATTSTPSSGIPTPTVPSNLSAIAGASGPLVLTTQGYINADMLSSHTTAPIDTTGGDLLVMCASSHLGVTMTPSDSFGNAWISAAGPTSTTIGDNLLTQVWYARIPTVGPAHTFTISLSSIESLVISVIVVKGSNTSNPIAVISPIGSDAGSQSLNVASPNITTTSTNNLLIGFAKSSQHTTWTSGAGFTPQTVASSSFLDAETALAPTPGSYSATFGIAGSATWQAVIMAVNPSAAANTPNQVNLSWTGSSEVGGTIASYLVERCQGVACTSFTQIGTSTNTSFNDTNVSPSNSYSYRVRAADTNNNLSSYSNTASAALSGGVTPTAPANLTATAASSSQINLSWTASTEAGGTINNYFLERCLGAGCTAFTQIASVAATTFNDTGLSASSSYSYRVRAQDTTSNLGPYSNTATSSTLAATITAPSSLTASSLSAAQINLAWTASTESGGTISSYLVERCQGTGCTAFVQIGTSTTTTLSNSGLTGSTSYSYRVRATDTASNLSAYSNIATTSTSAPTLTAPASLTATAVSNSQVNLSWTASTETGGTISSYLIERCQGTGCTTFTQIGTSTTTSFSSSGLTGSTSYSYRVRATDAASNLSAYSNTATASTSAPILTAPASLSATAASSTQINLSWTAATETGGTITSYLVERCQVAACTSFVQVGTSATTTFSNTGLANSTSYSFRVRATDAAGDLGPYSNTATVSTLSATPTAPTSLTATAISNTQVNLSWGASTETGGTISSYLVERCQGTSSTAFAQIGTATSTTFSDTGLNGSITYKYRVRAQDSAANLGPYSNTATVSTPAPTITAPASLTATSISSTQVNLSWTVATETGGTISNYLVERCLGAGCTTFTQIGTSTTTTFSNTGLVGSTSYSYRVRATDAVGTLGPYSNTASTTTSAPTFTAPASLTATATSNTQINLSWTAATETGGTISNYLVERCLGAGCTTFTQIGTSTTTTFSNTGLIASTSYVYRVRATDAASNLGPYSNSASATTTATAPPPPAVAFIQVNSAVPSSGAQVGTVYALAQAAGDLNVVIVGWNDTTAVVTSVSDTKGNSYVLAAGPTLLSGSLSQSIYYAKNIAAAAANSNTVTVKFSISANSPDIRILEYSGLDTVNPLDGATGVTGSSSTTDSGPLTTTNANDLLVGANIVFSSTAAPGTGFTRRIITNPDGDIAEDQLVSAVGSYHATASLTRADSWIMQIVAFKASGAAPSPTAPANLSASSISSSQINLSWSASTEAGGTISSYLLERCQGVGCSNFAQITSLPSTSFTDSGLAPSTSYSYRVRAQDTLGILGAYSNTATTSTPSSGIPTPTVPSNLSAIAGASGPLVLTTQGYINADMLSSHTTAPIDTTGGDLLVMCASSHLGVTMTPSDSFGNAWISAAGPTSTTIGDNLLTQVWYARIPTVGPAHTFTISLSSIESLVISVIVVKGSNTSNPIAVISPIGSDAGSQSLNVASPNITTTSTNNLLIGFAKSSQHTTWTSGAGFTPQTVASSSFLDAETALAPTPGSYSATFGIAGSATWQAVIMAVNPSAAANTPNQVNLSWTGSSEVGGTIASYLVERCQGVACTSFTQIGTSTNTSFNDTNVSPSNSYSYRVRAADTNNNLSSYSNTASAAL